MWTRVIYFPSNKTSLINRETEDKPTTTYKRRVQKRTRRSQTYQINRVRCNMHGVSYVLQLSRDWLIDLNKLVTLVITIGPLHRGTRAESENRVTIPPMTTALLTRCVTGTNYPALKLDDMRDNLCSRIINCRRRYWMRKIPWCVHWEQMNQGELWKQP